MTNYTGMTSEEIAGALWDAQSTTIAEESVYHGTAGREKFIEEYAVDADEYENLRYEQP